jgi:hypothetical protein
MGHRPREGVGPVFGARAPPFRRGGVGLDVVHDWWAGFGTQKKVHIIMPWEVEIRL